MVLKHGACILLFLFSIATAYDPFQGIPKLHCMKSCHMTGCNETLLEAYKRTPLSKDDQNINEADTQVFLFTRCNQKNPEFLHRCGGMLPLNTRYRARWNTVIIIGSHFSSVCGLAYFREMKDQFLYRDNYNVILIDWYWTVGPDPYGIAMNSKVLGKQIAFIILNIMKQTGATADQFHLIGHDQGAHAAGYTGRYIQILKGCKIGRITGLDPTGLSFSIEHTDNRLDPSDAIYVDVIHAGEGECFPAIGTAVKCGHADFYPNGGRIQLSCIPFMLESYLKLDIYQAIQLIAPNVCAIYQSVRYFLTSINACRCQYIAVECDNYSDFESGRCRSCGEDGSKCAVMGMDWTCYPHNTGNHSYFLKTSLSCPYCKNEGIERQGFPDHPTECENEVHCFDPKSEKPHCVP